MKILVFLFTITTPLFARIGETREQCVERYGEIVKEEAGAIPSVYFQKDDFKIEIIFHDGKAESITYEKKNAKIDENSENQPVSFPVKRTD